MPIDVFSKERFEKTLPAGLWESAGFVAGEYCYHVNVTPITKILIRSSIGSSGYASGTGENSIRIWLVDQNGEFVGSKLRRWTTRQHGWEERLLAELRIFWRIAKRLQICRTCGVHEKAFRVKKPGANLGRLFKSCNCQRQYPNWLNDIE